jgi:VanZ family protein
LPSPEQRWVDFVLEVAAHFVLYAILATLLMRALDSKKTGGWHAFGLAVLICAVYALSDEVHQSFVPDRKPDGLDIVVDLVGAAFGAGLWWYWRAVRRNRRSTEGL